MKFQRNIITALLKESDAYTSIDIIENCLEQDASLEHFPVQPLYLAIKQMPLEKVSSFLPKLSKEQRRTFLDLDLWNKDNLDVELFSFWISAYHNCQDYKIKLDFITSSAFSLFIKSRFAISTFDVEDPSYPEHDNFFLTDDNLLLFEFDENCSFSNELQSLIKIFYSEKGIEEAYTWLFKITVDSFLTMQEEEYQIKKERLKDYGFVDYYDALEINSSFPNLEVLENFIKRKTTVTSNIDPTGTQQALHNSSIMAFKDMATNLNSELQMVQSSTRAHFLHFNFIRLINATLELNDALKSGTVAMTKIGNKTRSLITLGFDYLLEKKQNDMIDQLKNDSSIFELFDFIDIYRIGQTLVTHNQKKIQKVLATSPFKEDNTSFLGQFWGEFLETSLPDTLTFLKNSNNENEKLVTFKKYIHWKNQTDTFTSIIPFASQLYKTFSKLNDSGVLQDSFYLNYDTRSIDLETILLNTYANFLLKKEYANDKKLGLTIDEFKRFATIVLNQNGKTENGNQELEEFTINIGINTIPQIQEYILHLVKFHIEGYNYNNLEDDEFKHVGGPIILATKN